MTTTRKRTSLRNSVLVLAACLALLGQVASAQQQQQQQGDVEDALVADGHDEQPIDQMVLDHMRNHEHVSPDAPKPAIAQAQPPQDQAREADRLYASSMKILQNLKTRNDAASSSSFGSSSGSSSSIPGLPVLSLSNSTSQLLAPVTRTPLLDYLEVKLTGRTKSLARLVRMYRRLTGRSTASDDGAQKTNQSEAEDFMTKIMKAKYLRMSSTKDSMHSKKKQAIDLAVERLEKAHRLGKPEAALALADLHLWGRYSLPANASLAYKYYEDVASLTGDPFAQYMLGFLQSTNYGLSTSLDKKEGEGDQGAAVLHYTFSALAGQTESELTMGYRHWVGVGVKQNCQDALPWYKSAASKAMADFRSGPPGGRHLPPPKIRLADVTGGVYGPGASATTQHHHVHSAQHAGHHHPTTEREWEDVLEFYHFHADRGDATFMFRIGRIYYQGFNPIGANGGFGGTENGGRDFARALRWFMRIARSVWPRDPIAAYTNPTPTPNSGRTQPAAGGPNRQTTQQAYYSAEKDVRLKVEDHLAMAAGLAAGYLGRMYLRGEGFPEQDYQKAFMWFQRGIGQGDRESHNGIGIMYRDGLGVAKDMQKALSHFQTAATADHAEALVNLGKYHFDRNEPVLAVQQFDAAIRHGSTFESYYHLAELNSQTSNRPDLCPVATAFYKIVAERGDWSTNEPWWEAEKAWARGDTVTALLGYWIMAERGYEVAQNNVAWILDQDKKRLALPHYDLQLGSVTDRLALTFWTRSAAQDNVDALVKMGDYYLKGLGVASGIPQPEKAAACYASAANTHVSSLAMHNLGWMHENGVGVSQDFHLAKRYYDLSLETNSEAFLPVTLSLVKLHLRSLYSAVIAGDIKSISLFLSNEYDLEELDAQGQPLAPGQTNGKAWFWSWRKIRDEFVKRWIGEEMARQKAQRQIQHHEARLGENANGAAPPPPAAPAQAVQATGNVRAQMEAQDDPVDWARRRREDMLLQQQQREDELNDDMDIPDFFGDTMGGRGVDGGDDLLETLAILGLCLVLGWLVYIRQARYDGARAGRQAAAPVPAANAQAAPTPAEAEEALRQQLAQLDEEDEPRP